MKKSATSMLGATLLEIMLVLAIAAMIIVMSVRFYQSASANQQATDAMQKVAAIVSAADSILLTSGDTSKVTTEALKDYLNSPTVLNTPWGTAITVKADPGKYTLTLPSTPSAVCNLLSTQVKNNSRMSSGSTACGDAAADFTIVYNK